MMFMISEDAVTALIGYLSKRPYEEVAGGIQVLQNLEKIEEKKDDTKGNTTSK